ncbi:Crp/Fnr family transcriptional regulator [Sphingobacterium yanglingense]|uniref:CRP-like cAMP-binding protein n=1 Tax=Sphingobacterium yanglingense TaxID=1437280 RepID=A0A4V3DCR7_9SPHI|nr:Crp/Fnr family transcriptional regulator [Sphingobacterium yanglingense]TDQ73443.1 CRP-like cAMP-binding protein [Sphingobacterium yanglingense]
MLSRPADILAYLESIPALNQEERIELSAICKPVFLPKRTTLVQSGDRFDYVFVLATGLLRWFFYSEDGTENNIFLTSEAHKDVIIGIPDYYTDQKDTKYNVESVIDTQLFLFQKDRLEELAFQYKGIFRFYIESLKVTIDTLRIRTEQLCSDSPSDRYEDFLKDRSFVTQNANRKHIANFLGITPNSLSRLSARINKKTPPKK